MKADNYNLQRFVEAQNSIYPIVLEELRGGRKWGHWMWYIFPQLAQLGYSFNSKFYGISWLDEAAAYLEHPVLARRLREVSEITLNLPTHDATEVFGGIDSQKLCSCMTLFDIVSPDDIFARILEKYFNGQRDRLTIKIINQSNA